MKKLLLATLMAASLPAMGATLTASNLNGNSFVDYSAEGLVSFDLNAINAASSFFNLNFSAAEVAAGSVSLNAVVNNFLAGGISAVKLDFGTTPVFAGTVQSSFNPGATGAFMVTHSPIGTFTAVNPSVAFEHYGVLVGNPFATGSNVDWSIDLRGLNAASTYSFSVTAVPEPGTWAMLFSGLGIIGVMARRRIAAK